MIAKTIFVIGCFVTAKVAMDNMLLALLVIAPIFAIMEALTSVRRHK